LFDLLNINLFVLLFDVQHGTHPHFVLLEDVVEHVFLITLELLNGFLQVLGGPALILFWLQQVVQDPHEPVAHLALERTPVHLVPAFHDEQHGLLVVHLVHGSAAHNHLPQDYTQRPDVSLEVVPLALLDLRGNLFHAAASICLHTCLVDGSEAKVDDLDHILCRNEDVFRLNVAMDDVETIQLGQRTADLCGLLEDLHFLEALVFQEQRT